MIKVEHLYKTFHTPHDVHALVDVSTEGAVNVGFAAEESLNMTAGVPICSQK